MEDCHPDDLLRARFNQNAQRILEIVWIQIERCIIYIRKASAGLGLSKCQLRKRHRLAAHGLVNDGVCLLVSPGQTNISEGEELSSSAPLLGKVSWTALFTCIGLLIMSKITRTIFADMAQKLVTIVILCIEDHSQRANLAFGIGPKRKI